VARVAFEFQILGVFLMIERDWLKHIVRRAKHRSAGRETRYTRQQRNGSNDDSLTWTDGLFLHA
jgi:hypothetical protein